MDRAMEQANRTIRVNDRIEDILDKLQDLQNSSRHSADHSQAAIETNNKNRRLKQAITVSERTAERGKVQF